MKVKHSVRRTLVLASVALTAACQDSPVSPVQQAEVDFALSAGQGDQHSRLARWFDQSSVEVLALPGAVFADHDEANGRLLFGVENSNAMRGVQVALSRMGIPSNAYTVVETAPVTQMVTLRDRFATTQGGIQINFPGYLCTMGFNVTAGGKASFITNSHCTSKQGGVESTPYYQPTSTVDNAVIATEVLDPNYQRNIAGCPKGKMCRRSDASLANYSGARASALGQIAKPNGVNNSSLTVDNGAKFTIAGEGTASVGQTANKVGRTSGWSAGPITNTCVTTNVSGTNIAQICQNFVTATVISGDSGSPVFRIVSGDSVELLGILWGGSGDRFVYSPIANVHAELGAFTVK